MHALTLRMRLLLHGIEEAAAALAARLQIAARLLVVVDQKRSLFEQLQFKSCIYVNDNDTATVVW